MERNLIRKNETKISWLQIIGFILILLSILYFIGKFLYNLSQGSKGVPAINLTAEEVSVLFFIIMLGFALAFPDMLQDQNKGLSTMRMVVFMMVNVICLLLLKIGWDKPDFASIKIDEYWMGIIAFIFGAKAVQTYFESRMAMPKVSNPDVDISTNNSNTILSGRGTAQLAINQNKEKLLNEHKNIKLIMPSYCLENGNRIPCVDIGITDNNKQDLPLFLNYKNSDDLTRQIKTRVIPNFNNARPQVGRGDFICNSNSKNFLGTVSCLLNNDANEMFALTCNHVLTGGDFASPGNLGDTVVEFFFGSFHNIGKWQDGKMNNEVDAALVSIDATEQTFANDVAANIYIVSEDDCSKTEIELVGALSNTQRAFIIHVDQSMPVDYNNLTVDMHNLISISTTLNHFNFTAPTQHADSGALVYHAATREPIGIIVGANDQFSFIIPMKSVLKAFDEMTLNIA